MIKMDKKDCSFHDKSTEYGLDTNTDKMREEEKLIHEKFVEYGTNAKEWMRKCVFLLPEIEKRRIWEKKGFLNIFEYAGKIAGMSRETVVDSLRIIKKIEDKPNLKEVAMQKGLNCIKPIVTIATKENEKYWAEKVKEMSKNTLAVFVKGLRGAKKHDNLEQQAIFEESERAGPSQQKAMILMVLDPEIAENLEKLKGNGSWDELMKELLGLRNKQLEIEKQKIINSEMKKSVKLGSRHIPVAVKRHVLKKTNGFCAFPGCKKDGEILHHTQRFALKKTHNPDKIVYLCTAHERLAHLGLVQNEDMSSENWKIREKPDADYENSAKKSIDQVVKQFRNPSFILRKI